MAFGEVVFVVGGGGVSAYEADSDPSPAVYVEALNEDGATSRRWGIRCPLHRMVSRWSPLKLDIDRHLEVLFFQG